MDGSDRKTNSLSSSSNKHSSLPKGTDENEQIYQESDKPTKMTTMKHFMSPTISATSKINAPRKKILAERNDFLDNYPQKNQNLDSKSIRKGASLDSKSISSTEFGDTEQNDDLSSIPYDPLSNYLSPRPKYLRYKPNRRREILLRRESVEREGKDGYLEPKKGLDFEGDLDSSFGSLSQEGEEIDESDDEFEEVDEERGWGLRKLLKVLILMVVLMVSTSYISSMNSPTPSPVVEAVSGLKDGYHIMQEHVIGFLKSIEPGKYILFDVDDGVVEEGMINDVKLGEAENSNGVMVEIQSGENKATDMFEDENEEEEVDMYVEGTKNENGGNEYEQEEKESIGNYTDGAKSENWEIEDEEEGENGKILDHEEKGIEGKWGEFIELFKENEAVYEGIREEVFERERGGIGNVTGDFSNGSGARSNMKGGVLKHMEIDSILKAVIGFSLVSSIIASMVLGLQFRKNRNSREKNTDHPVVEPRFDSVAAEKCISLIADEEEKHTNSPASSAISKSVINSMKEDSKATQKSSLMSFSHQSQAPIVELLTELEVGEEMSSSLRTCGTQNRIIESEASSHYVSMEKEVFGNKPNSIHVHVQPATFSEISTVNDLPSYSDEKKSMKKEEVVTTPLRRSSRIRNRAVSP